MGNRLSLEEVKQIMGFTLLEQELEATDISGSGSLAFSVEDKTLVTDESFLEASLERIFVPKDVIDLHACLKSEKSDPIYPLAGRSSLTGAGLPIWAGQTKAGSGPGLVLDLGKLNQQLDLIDLAGDQYLLVSAGCSLEEIERFLQPKGLRLPFRPSEPTASIGGVVANGAGGGSVRGGKREYERLVESLAALLAMNVNGDLICLANREQDAKFRAIDLVGSEGQALIFLSFCFKLESLPAKNWRVFLSFKPGLEYQDFWTKMTALGDLRSVVQMDYFDQAACRLYLENKDKLSHLKDLPLFAADGPSFYLEFAADNDELIEAELMEVLDLFIACGQDPDQTLAADTDSELKRFEQMRHGIVELIIERLRGKNLSLSGPDVARPILHADYNLPKSELAKLFFERERQLAGAGFESYNLAHIMPGQAHSFIAPEDEAEYENASEYIDQLARQSSELLGGFYSENGVGITNLKAWQKYASQDQKEQWDKIKNYYDPERRLNPKE